METNGHAIRRRFIIQWLIGIVTVVFAVTFFFMKSRDHIWMMHQTELLNLIRITSSQIDGNLHSTLGAVREDEQTKAYRTIKEQLKKIKAAVPEIRFLYTMVKGNNPANPNLWQFVVDAEENPLDMSHSGDFFDVTPYEQMRQAFEGPIAEESIQEDEWGTSLSAYAPVRNSDGVAVAIVGVDRRGSLILKDLDRLLLNTIIAGTMMMIAVSLVTVLFYRHQQNRLMKSVMNNQSEHIRKLEGLLPICSMCKNIRDDQNTARGQGKWKRLEDYISDHTCAGFTHTICPECRSKHYPDDQFVK